jgi:hypothetical protein
MDATRRAAALERARHFTWNVDGSSPSVESTVGGFNSRKASGVGAQPQNASKIGVGCNRKIHHLFLRGTHEQ